MAVGTLLEHQLVLVSRLPERGRLTGDLRQGFLVALHLGRHYALRKIMLASAYSIYPIPLVTPP